MKFRMKLWFVIFGVLLLSNAAYAENPREQLKQMVEQLQKTPTDTALRENIIKLAQTIKPAPVVPEEAERRMVRGTAALKGTKSVADYRNAAKEFELATLAAPWYGDAYFNLGVAQDKAENYDAALRSLKLALLASPNDKEIKTLIYEVEYRKERESSPEVLAVKMKQQEQEARRSLEGGVWLGEVWSGPVTHDLYGEGKIFRQNIFEVQHSRLIIKSVAWESWSQTAPRTTEIGSIELKNKRVSLNRADMHPSCNPFTVQFSDDGEIIKESYSCGGGATTAREYLRKH